MGTTRTLGEGRIVKIFRRCAFIEDDKLGKVYFPIDANLIGESSDLREKFEDDDQVYYSATRQYPPKNECNYIASSVVKPDELISVSGTIVHIAEKFALADVDKYGRVFIPFSARNSQQKPWLGRGACIDSRVMLQLMPQVDMNNCQYIAFSINIDQTTSIYQPIVQHSSLMCPLTRNSHTKLERQPDHVANQIGIVVASGGGEAFVYSTQTGMCYLSPELCATKSSWQIGSWLRYDVVKKHNDTDGNKYSWIGLNVSNKETPSLMYSTVNFSNNLIIKTVAVVCRISVGNNTGAWLFNDYIGRIYVGQSNLCESLKTFDIVTVSCIYKGVFEDVPWSAVQIDPPPHDVKLSTCAKLLYTDDNWKIAYVTAQPSGTYFGFITNESHGSAFFAWTDMTSGDTMPEIDTICRVTAYRQYRDTKHQWRAVLVTPKDKDGKLMYSHPNPSINDRLSINHNVCTMRTNSKKPSVDTQENSQHLSNESVDGSDNQLESINNSHQQSSTTTIVKQQLSSSNTVDQTMTNIVQQVLEQSNPIVEPSNSNIFLNDLSGRTSPSHAAWNFGIEIDHNCHRLFNDLVIDSTRKLISKRHDVMTQTDAFSEQIVLRDIISKPDILAKIIAAYPQHTQRILSIKWQ